MLEFVSGLGFQPEVFCSSSFRLASAPRKTFQPTYTLRAIYPSLRQSRTPYRIHRGPVRVRSPDA